jgi:hypothetical protein
LPENVGLDQYLRGFSDHASQQSLGSILGKGGIESSSAVFESMYLEINLREKERGMSETSEDKTKRKYLALLNGNKWSHQYSVFYDDLTLSNRLLTDKEAFLQTLRKQFPGQPFLVRIQTKMGNGRGDKGLQAYLMILTTAQSDVQEVADKSFTSVMNVKSKKLVGLKPFTIASAIDKQRPHDLQKVFGDVRIKRYSVLNKPMLVPV